MSVGDKQIEIPIVVEIHELRTKTERTITRLGQPQQVRLVDETTPILVAVQRVRLASEVGDEEVLVTVVVEVPEVHSHAGLFLTVLIVAPSRRQTDFDKMAAAILIQKVHRRVVGDVDVRVPIPIVIRQGDAETAPGEGNAGCRTHVDEVIPATLVAIENVGNRFVVLRFAIRTDRPALADLVRFESEIHVVGDKQVHIAVEIVIEKSGAAAPALIPDAGLLGDIRKVISLIVPQQHIRPEVGDE